MAIATNKNSRQHLMGLLLRIALFFGVSNHYFDREKQRLVYSPGAFVYRVSLHIASLILVIFNVKHIMTDQIQMLKERKVVMSVGYVYMCITLSVVLLGLISEWVHRGRGTKPFNELLAICAESSSVNSIAQAAILEKTIRLFWYKTMSVIVFSVTFLLTEITQRCPTVRVVVALNALGILLLGHVSIQYQFTIALLCGGYLFKVLNLRLSRVMREINDSLYISRRRSQKLSAELVDLGNCHSAIQKVLIRIKDIYQFDLLFILSTLFSLMVFSIFFVMVHQTESLGKGLILTYVFQFGNVIVNTADLLIILYICGDCIEACNASAEVLRDLRTSRVLPDSLKRDIETLCLHLGSEKLRLTICGMFDLDIHTGPIMLEGVLMKVILLTQIGYDDLRQQNRSSVGRVEN